MAHVYIANCGLSVFGQRKSTPTELIDEAIINSGLSSELGDVDGFLVANQAAPALFGEGLWAPKLATHFAPNAQICQWVNAGSAAGAAALEMGYHLVSGGICQRVLLAGFEIMTGLPNDVVSREISRVLSPEELRLDMTMAQGAAMVAARLRFEGLQNKEHWRAVAIKNHANAVANPYAHLRKAITAEQYEQAKIIAEPLGLFDCAPISDGAAIVLLTADPTDLRLSGVASGFQPAPLSQRQSLTRFLPTERAAARAFAMAGVDPRQVDIAEIHDAFTPFELIGLEACRLSGHGKAGLELLSGRFSQEGELPVNASGGLKGRGHPVGASGLAQIAELAGFMRGNRLYPRGAKRCALAHSIGGLATQNFVSILQFAS